MALQICKLYAEDFVLHPSELFPNLIGIEYYHNHLQILVDENFFEVLLLLDSSAESSFDMNSFLGMTICSVIVIRKTLYEIGISKYN